MKNLLLIASLFFISFSAYSQEGLESNIFDLTKRINEINFDLNLSTIEKRKAIDEAVDLYYQMNEFVESDKTSELPKKPAPQDFDEAKFDKMIEAENVKREAMLAVADSKSRGGFKTLIKKNKVWFTKGLHRVPKTKLNQSNTKRSNFICQVKNIEKYESPAYISVRAYKTKNDFNSYGAKVKGGLGFTEVSSKEIEKGLLEFDFLIYIQESGYYSLELYEQF